MKTMIVNFFCLTILCFAGNAQDIGTHQVASVVVNEFQLKFPNATNVEWELKGDVYKAEFEIGSREHDVWIDKSGKIKKHAEDFSKSELPAPISQKLMKEFKDYQIDDVDKIDTEGKIIFLVDLDGNSGDRKVSFSPEGNIEENKID